MKEENKSGKTAPEQSEDKKGVYMPERDAVQTVEDYNRDLKERIEEKRENSKLIKFNELEKLAPDFAKWLQTLVRYGNVDSQALIFATQLNNKEQNNFSVWLYTNDHCYSIYGYPPTEKNPKGYLGAGGNTRKPRVGEDWNRGNDLPDGNYSKKTFDKIVYGIVRYELKNLQLWR